MTQVEAKDQLSEAAFTACGNNTIAVQLEGYGESEARFRYPGATLRNKAWLEQADLPQARAAKEMVAEAIRLSVPAIPEDTDIHVVHQDAHGRLKVSAPIGQGNLADFAPSHSIMQFRQHGEGDDRGTRARQSMVVRLHQLDNGKLAIVLLSLSTQSKYRKSGPLPRPRTYDPATGTLQPAQVPVPVPAAVEQAAGLADAGPSVPAPAAAPAAGPAQPPAVPPAAGPAQPPAVPPAQAPAATAAQPVPAPANAVSPSAKRSAAAKQVSRAEKRLRLAQLDLQRAEVAEDIAREEEEDAHPGEANSSA